MIQRRRSPDGSNKDIDHGPGPVGKARATGSVGGVPATQGDGTDIKGISDYWNGRSRQK